MHGGGAGHVGLNSCSKDLFMVFGAKEQGVHAGHPEQPNTSPKQLETFLMDAAHSFSNILDEGLGGQDELQRSCSLCLLVGEVFSNLT